MAKALEFVAASVLIGGGATVAMDLWLLLLRRGLGVRTLDYAMLGRWLGHVARGTFAHENIAKARLSAGAVIGWCAHYAIGITFARRCCCSSRGPMGAFAVGDASSSPGW
jgi:hypothetical protein